MLTLHEPNNEIHLHFLTPQKFAVLLFITQCGVTCGRLPGRAGLGMCYSAAKTINVMGWSSHDGYFYSLQRLLLRKLLWFHFVYNIAQIWSLGVICQLHSVLLCAEFHTPNFHVLITLTPSKVVTGFYPQVEYILQIVLFCLFAYRPPWCE